MADFKKSIERVLKWEGTEYTNDPADPGGGTKYGITTATTRAHGYTGNMIDLPYDTAIAIYERIYWEPLSLDFFLSQPIADQLFQAAVNQGVGLWCKLLQGCINGLIKYGIVEVDGIIGAQVIAAVNNIHEAPDDEALSYDIYKAQIMRYDNIIDANPALEKFRQGWLNRAADFIAMEN